MRKRSSWIAVVPAIVLTAASCQHRGPQVASVPPPAAAPAPQPSPKMMQFTATAYTIPGKTASGAQTREGICAADPAVLPLGTRIRVSRAGRYSGEYVVKDSGPKIDGHEIDLYIADDTEAKRFGKKQVAVEVLHYGGGR